MIDLKYCNVTKVISIFFSSFIKIQYTFSFLCYMTLIIMGNSSAFVSRRR